MNDVYANSSASAIIAALAAAIAGGFAPAHQATVAVAGDPAMAIEMLAAGKPGGTAIVIFYGGDTAAGDEGLPEDTLVEAQIRIGVVRRVGLAAKPAAQPTGALAEAEALRTFVASRDGEGTLTGVYEYAGMAPLQTHTGELLHGYALTYKALYAYTV